MPLFAHIDKVPANFGDLNHLPRVLSMTKTPSALILLVLIHETAILFIHSIFQIFRHLLELMFILSAIFLYHRSLLVPRFALATEILVLR